MDFAKTIHILEALAAGCSPTTGEMLENESVLNERNVIRALQIAIDHLKKESPNSTDSLTVNEEEIISVVNLFKGQNKKPTSNNLTGFFLGTRQFKNPELVSNKLYGKFRGVYTTGQMLDFFSKFLVEKNIVPQNSFRDETYKQIDFFTKEKFNNLTENAISQLKEKINEIGILKTENLSAYIQEARKNYKRAYEQWSDKEMELLKKAIKFTNDLDLLSECFQRGKGSIETVGQKLILASQSQKEE